jgi:hypothetical protein
MVRRCVAASLVVMALACAWWPVTAHAVDPFVLFLLRMLRDQALSTAIESGATYSPQSRKPDPPRAMFLPPQPINEADRMRRLIDESFVHLSSAQRENLHSSLTRILEDPKNAPQRGEILAAFTAQAEATRQAHLQLSRLTDSEMRGVAAEARVEFARLPVEDRRDLMAALEQGIPGMPRTLLDAILAEFRTVPNRAFQAQ